MLSILFNSYIDMTQDTLQTTGDLGRIWGTVRATLISTESVPDFRGIGQDPEVFEKLAKVCFENVLPRKVWLSNFDKKPLSDFMTVADEALAYLVLENNFEDWMMLVKKEVTDTKKRKRHTKFTLVNGYGGSKVGHRKGWSVEGKSQYNKYFDMITVARKRPGVQKMETDLMNQWKVDEEEMRGSKELPEDTGPTEKGPVFTPRSGFDFAKFSEETV